MGPDAGIQADQARRYIGESRFHLATRPLLPQHHSAARIVANDVEGVLADIDADHGDRSIGCLRHGVLIVFGAPCPASLAGGAGARPDHPIADFSVCTLALKGFTPTNSLPRARDALCGEPSR
jgi:hypothetical protein